MKASWKKYQLDFKNPSGTSRGILNSKDSYFIFLEDVNKSGTGECGLLRGLSIDDRPDYEHMLDFICNNIHLGIQQLYSQLMEFPSIQFGLEMAFKDLDSDNHVLFPSDFTRGRANQAINGLIWMGDKSFMSKQVGEKLNSGFRVLKMKIGAIKLEEELGILKNLRSEFSSQDLEIRLDANGAFQFDEAKELLGRFSDLHIHSIEQPIAKGQWTEMAELCANTPLDIALDEELIGVFTRNKKIEWLETINPQYIILKPSFIGGFQGSEEWISLCNSRNIGWWVTSALESNIGLSAIAQWNYTLKNTLPSGLGTGSLYKNNFPSPLFVERGHIYYDSKQQNWNIDL